MTQSDIPDLMPSLVWEAPRVMTLHHVPVPMPRADEALIKIAYVGICGSELSGYLGHNALRVPPLVMGHEFSGEIAGMGEGAAAIGGTRSLNPPFSHAQTGRCNTISHGRPSSTEGRCAPLGEALGVRV